MISKKWSGLKYFRNHVLAHNYRIKEKGYQSVFLEGQILAYHIPLSLSDLTIILQCIDLVARVIHRYFQPDYENFIKGMIRTKNRTAPGCLNGDEVKQYFDEFNGKMLQGLKELAQRYGPVK